MFTVRRRRYHRNAAYEKELWRDENRKAFRNRQRVRRFTKRIATRAKTNSDAISSSPEKEHVGEPGQEQLDTSASTADGDNSGTWEIKNTSTTLRNGKSKGVSMKILFKPQEQRRLKRKMRKRGKIRYGLRKTVSAPTKLITQYQEQLYCVEGTQEGLHIPGYEVSLMC